jgi:hypothetical protein
VKTFKRGKFKVGFGRYDYDRRVVVFLWGDKMIMRVFRTPRAVFASVKFRLTELARHLQVWPVYFEVFRRDCDLCESTSLRRFPCYTLAMYHLRREYYEWTEGPFQFHQISRKEARAFKAQWRDRIGEAFDDGKGTRVILSLAMLFLIGCSEADQDKHFPRANFELFDGKVVQCRWVEQTPCGVKLTDCTDGQKYLCQTGVTEL